jgi:hypothetical protein
MSRHAEGRELGVGRVLEKHAVGQSALELAKYLPVDHLTRGQHRETWGCGLTISAATLPAASALGTSSVCPKKASRRRTAVSNCKLSPSEIHRRFDSPAVQLQARGQQAGSR